LIVDMDQEEKDKLYEDILEQGFQMSVLPQH
jgi:hypothetical protein